MNTAHPRAFKRTTLVWTLYLLLGLYAFVVNMIGPLIPYLRREFQLDYTFAALHMSAFAVGMILSGSFAPRILDRIGMMKGLWAGMAGILLGLVALVLAPAPSFSLGAILFMSATGTVSVTALQAILLRLFPEHSSKTLLESAVIASLAGATAPFVIAMGSLYFIGWRTVLPVFVVSLSAVALFGYSSTRSHSRDHVEREPAEASRMPGAFWLAWLLLVLGISTEFCVGFWSAEYLKGLPERSLELAAAGTGVFQLASLVGRVISSRLTGRIREARLLWFSLLLVLIGFPLYWLRVNALLSFSGLALCGLGVATFYPLAASLSFGASGGRASRVSSYSAVGAGLAVLSAPLLVGWVADILDLRTALLSIPIGVAAMSLLLFLVEGRRQRGHA